MTATTLHTVSRLLAGSAWVLSNWVGRRLPFYQEMACGDSQSRKRAQRQNNLINLGNANRSYSVRFDGRLFNTLTGIAEYSQERSGWAAANIEANGLAPPQPFPGRSLGHSRKYRMPSAPGTSAISWGVVKNAVATRYGDECAAANFTTFDANYALHLRAASTVWRASSSKAMLVGRRM
jgi:hypothetical protein